MLNFMRTVVSMTALAFLMPVSALADAENPVKLWTVEGLANPESALIDQAHSAIYVSNVNGGPLDKDGNGFISKVSREGKLIELRWVEGLDGPKGMALYDGRLYVSDIDQLVVIDVATAKVERKYQTHGAKFLNDVAAGDGSIYVSDMFTNTIHRLQKGQWEAWLQDDRLNFPNGLWHGGDSLLVACWGSNATDQTGNGGLVSVNLSDRSIMQFSKENFGHLDGLEKDIDGDFYVTDWQAGILYHVELDGQHDVVMELSSGFADIGYVPQQDMLLAPMMKDNVLHAFKMHAPVKE